MAYEKANNPHMRMILLNTKQTLNAYESKHSVTFDCKHLTDNILQANIDAQDEKKEEYGAAFCKYYGNTHCMQMSSTRNVDTVLVPLLRLTICLCIVFGSVMLVMVIWSLI